MQADPLGDSANATQLFYVPFAHSFVPIWNDSLNVWQNATIPSAGIALASFPLPNSSADIVAFGGAGLDVAIMAQGWAGDSGRLFPINFNGLRCIDYGAGGSPRYRTYLGSIRITGSGSASRIQDTTQFRHVWNAHNQAAKPVQVVESANSWLTNTIVYRNLNNNSNNRLELFSGLTGLSINISGRFSAYTTSGQGAYFAITNNNIFDTSNQVALIQSAAGETSVDTQLLTRSALGLNTVRALELTDGSSNVTFFGYGRNGLRGFWLC